MGLIADIVLKKRNAERERDQLLTANSQLVEKVDALEKTLQTDVIVLDEADKAALAEERNA
jgi:hypothetical protein